ncbi:MAG: protein-methionine-sulfoxide reductase catalytic subunit MsrP [Pyrinomonadaceae bacterium]
MLIKKPDDIKSSEITSQANYLDRRNFIKGAALAGTVAATGLVYKSFNSPAPPPRPAEKIANLAAPGNVAPPLGPDDKPNTLKEISNYNNFYEFTTDKAGVAAAARNFVTKPWNVVVDGLVNQPQTFGFEDLLKIAPQQERIYRHRCVEAWSMVIPWVGFPLKALLDRVQPQMSARYVAFQTLYDPKQFPGQGRFGGSGLDWPYVEGLRLDEAMHPLAILATGIYGETLLPQNGAPIRLVLPWKYGFKGIKSIVKITLTDSIPPTTWNRAATDEYGFYSNVNPDVAHPRWSQAMERRIGEFGQRKTLLFNGYADQVASLYTGMDLRKDF